MNDSTLHTFSYNYRPREVEQLVVRQSGNILSYGKDNLYPQYLIKLFNSYSPVHNQIVISKASMISGDGFAEVVNPQLVEYMAANNFESLLNRIALDYVLFKGFSLEVVYSNDRTRIASVKHVPFDRVRIARPNEETCEVQGYYVSSDWANARKKQNKPVYLPKYNPTLAVNQPKQLLYYHPSEPGDLFYPTPSYSTGLDRIETDHNLSVYQNALVANSFSPSASVKIIGKYNEEQEWAIRQQFDTTLTGPQNAGKAMVFFNENPQGFPVIESLGSVIRSEDFSIQSALAEEKIAKAHGFPRILANLEGSGSLGGNGSEYYTTFNIVYDTQIRASQRNVLEVLNMVLKYNGFEEGLEIKKPDFINQFGQGSAQTVFNINNNQLSPDTKL